MRAYAAAKVYKKVYLEGVHQPAQVIERSDSWAARLGPLGTRVCSCST
jgi:hypothetical protein